MSATADPQPTLRLRIARAWPAAEGIRSFELVDEAGAQLPPFVPGSHLRIQVPNGAWRKYSLCNPAAESDRYVITVKRDANGQGGSVSLVDDAREGQVLAALAPENAFELVASSAGYVFVAGGIGITPIVAMIRSLADTPEVPWKLYYLTRSPQSTAFRDELRQAWPASQVVIHHDHGNPDDGYDLWPVFEKPSARHIYCCGPRPLMEAVRDMTGHWSRGKVHFESFDGAGTPHLDDKPFTVRLARSGRRFEIPVGQTILATLNASGCKVPYSCESGTCGTCRTTLLEGDADHRDMVLMDDEKEQNIMVCVSRAKSAELVLDL